MAGALLAVMAGSATASATPRASDHRSTAAVLQRGLDDLRAIGVTGTQGLVRDGKRVTVARSGVSDVDTGAPMPADGYFRIGSATKTFTSVVLLQLAGEGRIGLDDPVARWLPGVVTHSVVTVRQVLQQTSGFHDYLNDLTVRQSADEFLAHRFDHFTDTQLVAMAMRHPPLFPAGTRWNYSNTNYIVAGMLVERVTGHRWHTEVRSRILAPLRLTHTFYPGDRPALPAPHAKAYHQFAPGEPLVDTTLFNPTVTGAAGGLVSTTTDLARFWQAVARGELLGPRQMAELRTTVLAEEMQGVRPGLAYGLGIMWIPSPCGGFWAHIGDMPGVTTLNAVTPDGRRSAVFYVATALADPDRSDALMRRELTLLDDLSCG